MLEVYKGAMKCFQQMDACLAEEIRLLRFYLPKASENSRSPGCHGGILPCSLCPVMNLYILHSHSLLPPLPSFQS